VPAPSSQSLGRENLVGRHQARPAAAVTKSANYLLTEDCELDRAWSELDVFLIANPRTGSSDAQKPSR
jgi:hypothetical protein